VYGRSREAEALGRKTTKGTDERADDGDGAGTRATVVEEQRGELFGSTERMRA
jgi:hypothetical protein